MRKRIVAGLIAVGAMCALAGCGKEEIDLSKFVKVDFQGVDGKGSVAGCSINKDELDDALRDANDDLSKKERQKLMDSIETSLKKEKSNLSNGDKVVVKIDWSERKAERYDIEFTGEEAEVKVKGLKELEEVDAFKDIELKYTGISPYVRVEVKNTSKNKFLKNCSYSVEYPTSNRYAKVGDKIEVTVNYSEYNAEEMGYTVKDDTKEFTIKAKEVDAYITAPDAISGEALTEMVEAAQSVVDEEIFDNIYSYRNKVSAAANVSYGWDFDESTISKGAYKLDKMSLLVIKDEDDGEYQYNKMYMIIENTVQDAVCVNPVTLYYAVGFKNVFATVDGKIDVDLDEARLLGTGASLADMDALIEKEAARKYDVTSKNAE